MAHRLMYQKRGRACVSLMNNCPASVAPICPIAIILSLVHRSWQVVVGRCGRYPLPLAVARGRAVACAAFRARRSSSVHRRHQDSSITTTTRTYIHHQSRPSEAKLAADTRKGKRRNASRARTKYMKALAMDAGAGHKPGKRVRNLKYVLVQRRGRGSAHGWVFFNFHRVLYVFTSGPGTAASTCVYCI
jgi:hypothetical protein